ncbi:hypothetical protein AB0D56_37925 [Streptomyces sp. NPDC048209]|uniref:hypothetical protein n=1 Tax=Streptomyces sp. NPDC048209 TaxID=3156689 RepID=UPI003415FD29
MRKRTSRPPRFVMVDNAAVDTLPALLAVGLLTRLVRARDGEEVTVEKLARSYAEGEDALSKAMRILVEAGNVVKFKVQRAASEEVTEPDGSVTTKRGGSWWTTFSVDSIPFTLEDVATMAAEIRAQGNVRALRVEPTRLDPDPERRTLPPVARQAKKRTAKAPNPPAPGNPGVGPTCDDSPAGSGKEPRPTPGFPGVGRPAPGGPTPGQGGAHNYLETEDKKTGDEPPVRPSVSDRGARASDSNRTNGGTDGGEVEQQDQEQTEEPVCAAKALAAPGNGSDATPPARPTAPAAPVASEGQALLIEAARRDERAALPGPMLNEQGLYVEGLLAAGWSWSELMPQITAPRPPKEKIRVSDAAMTVARIRAIPMTPPANRGTDPAPASVPAQMARPAAPKPYRPPCPGTDGHACGRPISTPGASLCAACESPCPTGCGRAANHARLDKLCHPCAEQADDERLSRCANCGQQPATRTSGMCGPCHRARHDADQEQAVTPDEVLDKQAAASDAALARTIAAFAHPTGATRPGGCIEGVNGCSRDAVRDGRCEDCHDIWTGHQEYMDLLAPAYAGQEGTQPPF